MLHCSMPFCWLRRSACKIRDFYYKRNRFPVSASFTYLKKYEFFVHGFSVGINPDVYARYVLGVNAERFEVGGFVDAGINFFSENSFDFYECVRYSPEGCLEFSEIKHLDNEGGWRLGAGLYASLFVGRFALSYSPSIYHNKGNLEDADYEGVDWLEFRVNEPFVLSQYMGASVWVHDHWKVTFGVTALSPLNFDDLYWTINSSVGYWF